MTLFTQVLTHFIIELSGKRTGADAGGVSLDNTQHKIDIQWAYSGTGSRRSGSGIG